MRCSAWFCCDWRWKGVYHYLTRFPSIVSLPSSFIASALHTTAIFSVRLLSMSSSSVQNPASQVPFTQSEKDVWYVDHNNLQSFCSGTNGVHYQYFRKMFVHSFSNPLFGAQFDSAIRAVFPSKRFHLKTKISISAGDASDHKSFFTQSENQLDWSLKSPMCVAFSTCFPFLL